MVLIHQLLLAHCCYGIPHLQYDITSRFSLQCNRGVSLPHTGVCPLWLLQPLQLCSSTRMPPSLPYRPFLTYNSTGHSSESMQCST